MTVPFGALRVPKLHCEAGERQDAGVPWGFVEPKPYGRCKSQLAWPLGVSTAWKLQKGKN